MLVFTLSEFSRYASLRQRKIVILSEAKNLVARLAN